MHLNWLAVSPYQAGESVLSALGACKILRELSKLENDSENKLAMKQLAQRFEKLANGEFAQRKYLSVSSFKAEGLRILIE